jgi:hypothetical protein
MWWLSPPKPHPSTHNCLFYAHVCGMFQCFFQMSYEISKICTCEIIDEKNPQRTVFRVIRVGKDGNYKNMDFETTLMTASESHCWFINIYSYQLECTCTLCTCTVMYAIAGLYGISGHSMLNFLPE